MRVSPLEPVGSAATIPGMEAPTARRLAHGAWFGTLALVIERTRGHLTTVTVRVPARVLEALPA